MQLCIGRSLPEQPPLWNIAMYNQPSVHVVLAAVVCCYRATIAVRTVFAHEWHGTWYCSPQLTEW